MTKIVCFAGPAQVGKTTTANKVYDILSSNYPYLKIIKISFAYKLYEICSILTGVDMSVLESQEYKNTPWTTENAPLPFLVGWTPRSLLQKIGTECFRKNINDDFWVQVTLRHVQDYDIALISDARFENELKVSDINFELSRSGIEYAMNHASAMPPPQHLIHYKLHLHENTNYYNICDIIINHVKVKDNNVHI